MAGLAQVDLHSILTAGPTKVRVYFMQEWWILGPHSCQPFVHKSWSLLCARMVASGSIGMSTICSQKLEFTLCKNGCFWVHNHVNHLFRVPTTPIARHRYSHRHTYAHIGYYGLTQLPLQYNTLKSTLQNMRARV